MMTERMAATSVRCVKGLQAARQEAFTRKSAGTSAASAGTRAQSSADIGNAMDAVDFLVKQHRLLEMQFESLLSAQGEDARRASLAEVGDHLGVHLASEEEVFYPAVRAQHTEDDLLESLEEHLSLKRLLADLLALQPADETFTPKCKVLAEQAVHHHKEEEEHLFPAVRDLLDTQELERLGSEMLALQGRMRREDAPREVIVEQTDEAAKLD